MPHKETEGKENGQKQQGHGRICHIEGKQYRVIDSVSKDRGEDYHHLILCRRLRIEFDQRIIVAHQHSEREMGRNGEQGPHNADRQEAVIIIEQIDKIFSCRKPKRHAHSIHYSVKFFVKMPVFPQQEPQHDKLGDFFRNGSPPEGGHHAAPDCHRFVHIQAEISERS